jgi:DNA/RNA endonuclease G (NUC1)
MKWWLIVLLTQWDLAFGRVLRSYFDNDCTQFFFDGFPPRGIFYNLNEDKSICQTFNNREQFATLYSTTSRIPIFSAYISTRPSTGRSDKPWKIEPQLTNLNRNPNMEPEQDVDKINQAVKEDFTGFDGEIHRGHLNPDLHNSGTESKEATYTLTNVVPMTRSFNSGSWKDAEGIIIEVVASYCARRILCTAYHVTGNFIGDKSVLLNDRVMQPDTIWTAVCVVRVTDEEVETFALAVLGNQFETQGMAVMSIEHMNIVLSVLYGRPVSIFRNNCQSVGSRRNGDEELRAELMISSKLLKYCRDKTIIKKLSKLQATLTYKPFSTKKSYRTRLTFDSVYSTTIKKTLGLAGLGCLTLPAPFAISAVGRRKRQSSLEDSCIPQLLQTPTVTAGNSICVDGGECQAVSGKYLCKTSTKSETDYCCAPSSPCQDQGDYYWCYVDEAKSNWEYCSPPYSSMTIGRELCREGHTCGLHGEDYFWCYTDDEGNWDYCCAPYSPCDGKYCQTYKYSRWSSYIYQCGTTHIHDELKKRSVNANALCPEDWIGHCWNDENCFCYRHYDEPLDWHRALQTCNAFGQGSLSSVHSQHQMELLKNFVMAGNTSWIGLNRKSASEKFSWSDGSQVDYTFWFAGQHQIVASEDEHCVVAYADGGDPEVKWSTAKCSQRHTFICQIPELEVPRHEAQKCHENWRQFCGPDGKCACYAYIKEPMSWLDASDYCTDRYSHLRQCTLWRKPSSWTS